MHYVDYKNGLTRYKKESAKWYKSFISAHGGDRKKLRDHAPGAVEGAQGPAQQKHQHRELKTNIFSAFLGFFGALVLVSAFMTGRAWARHSRSGPSSSSNEIELDVSRRDEDPEDIAVRTDLLSPRGLGEGRSFRAPRLARSSSSSPTSQRRGSPTNMSMSSSMSMNVLPVIVSGEEGTEELPSHRQAAALAASKSASQLSNLTHRSSKSYIL